MPKYLIHGSYTAEGKRGLLKDGGSKRKGIVEGLIGGQGGSLESIYWAFGGTDLYAIVDMPNNASMAAVAIAVAAGGAFEPKIAVLLTPEEIDAAVQKDVNYTPGITHS